MLTGYWSMSHNPITGRSSKGYLYISSLSNLIEPSSTTHIALTCYMSNVFNDCIDYWKILLYSNNIINVDRMTLFKYLHVYRTTNIINL